MADINSIPLPAAYSNLPTQLFLQTLRRLGLLEALDQVPFALQRRRTSWTPAARCLCLLGGLASGCQSLRGWRGPLRQDSPLQQQLGTDRRLPDHSTLSRSLAAATDQTAQALRRILQASAQPVLEQALRAGQPVLIDMDDRGLPAEGNSYQGTGQGHMPDGSIRWGYRLHSLSWQNRWMLDQIVTAADVDPNDQALRMVLGLRTRLPAQLRERLVFRGDAPHGCRRVIRPLQRYHLGYLLRGASPAAAAKLWQQARHPLRVPRREGPDLLAQDLGPQRLRGNVHGARRRRYFQVPRVVVYHEDPAQVPAGRSPDCFLLLTSLSASQQDSRQLLELYTQRAGDIENLYEQQEAAFTLHHLRSRRYWGNHSLLVLAALAGNLTQWIRQEALEQELPIPLGLDQTLQAARQSGLSLRKDPQAGWTLQERADWPDPYRQSFRKVLQGSYQRLLRLTG